MNPHEEPLETTSHADYNAPSHSEAVPHNNSSSIPTIPSYPDIANLGTYLPHDPHPHHIEDSDLLTLVQSYEWSATLRRISTHPSEATSVGEQGRTPLHVACDHDAPAFIIDALLKANPGAATMVGTSDMNPLHITCSSQHACLEVVRVLLDGSDDTLTLTAMKDVDGDRALHAACRCGAPIQVLEVLLRANPAVVHDRDYEGLTPLLRLWVRYFVTLGDDVINGVGVRDDVNGELAEAWSKTELLLRAAYYGSIDGIPYTGTKAWSQQESLPRNSNALRENGHGTKEEANGQKETPREVTPFRALHAASAVDCPRAVVKIATVLYPQQLEEHDSTLRTPLMAAAMAPVFKEHDLSDEGYSLEEMIHGDDVNDDENTLEKVTEDCTEQKQPTVLQILLEAGADAKKGHPDLKRGRLPLNSAIVSGKRWHEGVKVLRNFYPDSVMNLDLETGVYPFMLAAAAGIGDLTEEVTTKGRTADLNTIYEILRSRPECARRRSIKSGVAFSS
jgi:hypothetical protein